MAQLKIYDPSTQQQVCFSFVFVSFFSVNSCSEILMLFFFVQIAPPPLEQPPASRRTAPKKWQDVETAPQMVHVAGLSDDELVDELIKVKKELHEANRKIELLEYELELAQRKRNAVNVGTEEGLRFIPSFTFHTSHFTLPPHISFLCSFERVWNTQTIKLF